MSYSRWSNSYWYTFWHVYNGSDKHENRNNAIFTICDFDDKGFDFCAAELRKDLPGCLAKVSEKHPDGDLVELTGYMLDFLEDIEERYPKRK